MLWGELGTCDTSVIDLTETYCKSSSSLGYMPCIKDPDTSHCHLPGCCHFQRSGSRNSNDAYFRRGTHFLRYSSVRDYLYGSFPTSKFYYLDIQYRVGGPRTMSRNLDCCQTLPWTTTTFDGRDYRGLFRGVDENSCGLLCEASSCYDSYSFFLTEESDMIALLQFLDPISFLISPTLISTIPWAFGLFTTFFKLRRSCRCLC
ncbi:uncharacterized protein F5147DRAFT_196190 [Suillus discolor]|uniref:Uncharacterized protein n=1 Tax=Suillus discolor TaxID=1912936 RepID=A0A9P7FKY2_9AGAM|nr:uncharacterized protein F5147DRAFT_196190 [Suillus discolor]KAG2119060.1 hypothetical protein F5147DRAFT_196190 [Suillus discolor]